MSETRTGLRNRIWHTMRQSRDRHPEIRNSLGAEIDAGEAVYAQALRDVLAHAKPSGFVSHEVAKALVTSLAAEKGITLDSALGGGDHEQ